jgi:hypothetical protein
MELYNRKAKSLTDEEIDALTADLRSMRHLWKTKKIGDKTTSKRKVSPTTEAAKNIDVDIELD